jgi:hypothetical protein
MLSVMKLRILFGSALMDMPLLMIRPNVFRYLRKKLVVLMGSLINQPILSALCVIMVLP